MRLWSMKREGGRRGKGKYRGKRNLAVMLKKKVQEVQSLQTMLPNASQWNRNPLRGEFPQAYSANAVRESQRLLFHVSRWNNDETEKLLHGREGELEMRNTADDAE